MSLKCETWWSRERQTETRRMAARSASRPGCGGASAALPGGRPRGLLRQLGWEARHEALPCDAAPDHAELRAGGGLELVLRRRALHRARCLMRGASLGSPPRPPASLTTPSRRERRGSRRCRMKTSRPRVRGLLVSVRASGRGQAQVFAAAGTGGRAMLPGNRGRRNSRRHPSAAAGQFGGGTDR